MKKTAFWTAGLIVVVVFGCTSLKLSKENYVNLMSEMGCGMMGEGTPQVESLYGKYGVTQADIDAFRKNSSPDVMMAAAGQIAQRVAACHGATLPANP